MNTFKVLFLSFVLFAGMQFMALAQNNKTPGKRKCDTDQLHQQMMQSNPEYAKQYQKLQDFTNDFVAKNPNGYSPKAVVTIPVVFHVILSAAQHTAFTDDRLEEQITVLNEDYGGLNTHSMGAFATSLKSNTELQFCLAQEDTTGAPSTGINRLTSTHGAWLSSEDSDIKHTAQGGLDQWDPNRYLNVWIVELGGGLCGYAYYPTPPLSDIFGLVCHYEYTGVTGASAPYNLGGTVSHEIGHCFNLKHIWGDSGGCSPDDLCDDTPLQDIEQYGAPTGVITDACSTTSPGIMYMNFMDYVDDVAYANFTPDQKTRLQACFAVGGPLEQLGQSTVSCSSVNPNINANFTGTPTTGDAPLDVTFTNTSGGTVPPTSWEWSFPGGTPSSYSGEIPPTITYSAAGSYSVTLIVSNGTDTDTLIRTDYITVTGTVYPPVADFSATPTTILTGSSVSFLDLSTNGPTSWSWAFTGGTPSTFIGQNPPPITYSAPGSYNVSLTVTNSGGNNTKLVQNCIIVSNPNPYKPEANFVADRTTILAGDSISFIDLSQNTPITWQWTFEGGTPATDSVQHPQYIKYNAAGTYNVKLIAINSNGSDSLIRVDYVTVLDSIGSQPPVADFDASTRMFTMNSTIYFEDMSTGNPTQWDWTFEGGSPATSTQQNPTGITYTNPGWYDVCLTVSNMNGSNTLCKSDFILVTTGSMGEYCDTISNVAHHEQLYYRNLTNSSTGAWGYLPGRNNDEVKAYADKFVDYRFSEIRQIVVPVKIAKSGGPSSTVRFRVWSGTDIPVNALGYSDVTINSMSTNYVKVVTFNPPVQVDGRFFLGYEVNNTTPGDTFVCAMANDRPNGPNTLYVMRNNNAWSTCYQMYGIQTSLAIDPIACLVGVEEVIQEKELLIYPNPTRDKIHIQIEDDINLSSVDIKVFDMMGKLTSIRSIKDDDNHYTLEFSNHPTGIYFINFRKGDTNITKKISVVK